MEINVYIDYYSILILAKLNYGRHLTASEIKYPHKLPLTK